MPRPLRIAFPGAWYHIMNRGAGRRPIFSSNYEIQSRQQFMGRLIKLHDHFQIEIHAYCLMGNHYHLLLKTPLANISKGMQYLNSTYTLEHNVRNSTDGPLFRGRYKSILVEADSYLLQLSRYIHLNPVEAGITKKPGSYYWSSYRAYMNTGLKPEWLITEKVLGYFDVGSCHDSYQRFVEEGIDDETMAFFKKQRRSAILGSDEFKRSVLENNND